MNHSQKLNYTTTCRSVKPRSSHTRVAQRAVEMTGLEPVTLALQRRCSPN